MVSQHDIQLAMLAKLLLSMVICQDIIINKQQITTCKLNLQFKLYYNTGQYDFFKFMSNIQSDVILKKGGQQDITSWT